MRETPHFDTGKQKPRSINVRPVDEPTDCRATDLIPCYISNSRIKIGDSRLCRRWKSYCPTLLLLIERSAVVYGYHHMAHRCSIGVANPLKYNFASL
ncbi:hypothetical protein HAX54_022585, partial [Datura stramonium]|nr:hypothetical protein [Datura stramonium]